MSTESPAVARRRLRLALRRLRETKAITQGQVADALEWSLSKVNRIESGDVTISNTDLRALLALLDVTDADTIRQLTADARASRRRGWWDEPRYREYVNPATLQLIQFESEASAIRCFQPSLVPGLLQTPAYANAIFDYWRDMLDESGRQARLEVRINRSKQVLDRENPPTYLVILDESVLLREIGGTAVLAEQLDRLLMATDSPATIVRILPLANAGAAMTLAFTILDLENEENAVLYRETDLQDEVVHAADRIRHYRGIFESLWEQSHTPDASRHIIRERLSTMVGSAESGAL